MLAPLKQMLGNLPLQRWLHRAGSPAVVVLMYHDLCDDDDLANWLRVPVSLFEAQLDALAAMGDFVGPSALHDPGNLPTDRLSFLITFDDGYHNNISLAAPILERRGIPALYFVSTGPMLSRQPFWTDVVVTPIQAQALPSIDLSDLGFGRFEFRSGPPAQRWDDVQRLLVAIKNVGNEDDPRVADLLSWFQDHYRTVLAEHLPRFSPLAVDEVRLLAGQTHARIGSHGHEHRILTRLDDSDLARALQTSRQTLTDIAGTVVDELAYPNGDHDLRVRTAATVAGYRCGYTVDPRIATGDGDPLAIPRLTVSAFDAPSMLRFQIFRLLLAGRRQPAANSGGRAS